MALIKCKECDKEISDTISNCIHCGFEISQKGLNQHQGTSNSINKKSKGSSTYIIIPLLLIIGFILWTNASVNDSRPTERDLRNSDIQISHTQGLTSVTVTVIPRTNIRTLTLSFTLYNSSGQVIWSDVQTRNNLTTNNSVSFTFNFGISGALTGGSFRISPSGRVSAWN